MQAGKATTCEEARWALQEGCAAWGKHVVGDRVVDLAKGGRYDGVGEAFGRSRPATGFSADLVQWVAVTPLDTLPVSRAILAPCLNISDMTEAEKQLREKIATLRAAGETVIVAVDTGVTMETGVAVETGVSMETSELSESRLAAACDRQLTCNRQLVWQAGTWQVIGL